MRSQGDALGWYALPRWGKGNVPLVQSDRCGACLTERLTERFLRRGPDSNQGVRNRRLRDVAWGPSVETGAGVPGYSGGLAAAWWFRIRFLL
jgi:hypothetical protein